MNSLSPLFLQSQSIPLSLLGTVRLLGEYKGKHDLFIQQAPQILETLQESARIESIESSNRIEGVVAPPERFLEIARRQDAPRNRSEQEIAGYRDVLATIHTSYEHIPLTPNIILQLHRDMYRFQSSGMGGHWKAADNEIAEVRPDGTRVVRFRPLPAWRTSDAMLQLCDNFRTLRVSGEIDSLLLIPAFVLDFLCIHPFSDGNGRMSRLLTLLLLYQSGYLVGRYISLERIIEEQKAGYYETLHDASLGWMEGQHSLVRWWDYFLGVVLLTAYREFEGRVGAIGTRRGIKRELVLDVIRRLPHRFRFADVERACPDISRPTIQRVFEELKRNSRIELIEPGPRALWQKIGTEESAESSRKP